MMNPESLTINGTEVSSYVEEYYLSETANELGSLCVVLQMTPSTLKLAMDLMPKEIAIESKMFGEAVRCGLSWSLTNRDLIVDKTKAGIRLEFICAGKLAK